jgi:hypothetical protein
MGVKIWPVTAKFSFLSFSLAAIPENRKRKWAVFLLVPFFQIIEGLSLR